VLDIKIDLEVLIDLSFLFHFDLASHLKLFLLFHFKLVFELFANLGLFRDLDLTVARTESLFKTAILSSIKIALTVFRLSTAVSMAGTTDTAETASVTGQVSVVSFVLIDAGNSFGIR